MRVFLTGDVHADIDDLIQRFKAIQATKEEKVALIILGDFGVPWGAKDVGKINYLTKWLQTNRPLWILLFIDGNHENFDLLEKFPIEPLFGGLVSKLSDKIFWLRRGEVYKIGNFPIACFGGALSIDKERRKEGSSWWAIEQPTEEDFERLKENLKNVVPEETYLLTHTADSQTVLNLLGGWNIKVDRTSNLIGVLKHEYDFKYHFFGHFHETRLAGPKTRLLFDTVFELGTE